MSTARAAAILMIALAAWPCMAQSNPVPQPGSQTPATNPAAGPGEPDIVMPQVVLQVEDLSVEKVEAQLPPEEEMLPPLRTIPALSEGELAVGEPTIPAAGVETEGAAAPSNTRLLSSEVQVGTGTQNMILGSVSLKTLGPDLRFSVQIRHETLDGFAGKDPGSGFNLRNDSLDGGLKFRLGGISTDLAGSFKEEDAGLQGLGGLYSSDLTRAIGGTASFSGDPADWVTVTLSADGGVDSMTLQGDVPEPANGLRISPAVSALARFGTFKIGLETRYWYRDESLLFSGTDQMHRVKFSTVLSLELPATFVIEARGGWFYNTAGLSLFSFSLSLTGTPLDFLTVSLEGGYKIVPYDMHDILTAGAFVLPGLLVDDRGWYADASVQLSLMRELSATVKAAFMVHDAMPTGSTIPDPVHGTGLFPVSQASATQLSTSAGLRWGITQAFSLSAGWNHELMDRPFFTPIDSVTAGIVGLDSSGRFGASFTIAAGPIADGTLQQPVLHVSGFWKIIDAVKLQIDGDDLLAPLSGSDRWSVARDLFITPGFRIIGSLSMSL